MKALFTYLLTLVFSVGLYAQQGPGNGSIPSGVVVSTDNFTSSPSKPPRFKLFNKWNPDFESYTGRENPVEYVMDRSFTKSRGTVDSIIQFRSFDGIPEQNGIPPDPYIAVGPDHILQVVNSVFRISDKEGNTIKTISADDWFSSALPSVNSFDPKVIYDHFAGRWIQVWLHADDVSSQSYFLISVSDDEDPLGTWFNWAMPSNVNGSSPSGSWADYQGLGYDQRAIYLSSNQFTFSNGGSYSYQGSKIWILPKDDLYAESPGELNWVDFWNLSDFGLRPVRVYDEVDDYYFVRAPQGGGSYMYFLKLEDPLGIPSLTREYVQVSGFQSPPDAGQLGGGQRIDGGGANLRNEPVFKDGKMFITHAVRMGQFSAVRYLELDPVTKTVYRDFAMGTGAHYYTYPALAVDHNNNVVLTYSRSSNSEYMGAYYTILYAQDEEPVGSITLKDGVANYVKTLGADRNRWGDYMGAWLDPADSSSFWLMTEYVKNLNRYGSWVGAVRARPFEKPTLYASESLVDFGYIEAGVETSTDTVTIKNYGSETLTISSISNELEAFELVSAISLPINLSAYDSVKLVYQFDPEEKESYQDVITITSNDPQGERIVGLSGEGYVISNVEDGTLYAYSQLNNKIVKVSPSTGEPTEVGETRLQDIFALSINPVTDQMFGAIRKSDDESTDIVRFDAADGEAYVKINIPIYLNAAAFDTNGVFYGVDLDQDLYRINLEDGALINEGTFTKGIRAMVFNPLNNELWVTAHEDSSENDAIYKVDLNSGADSFVGNTGTGRVTEALAFDENGNLYGTVVKAFARSYLLSIDTTNAAATEIGIVDGVKTIAGLAYSDGDVVSVEERPATAPVSFALKQNYPNPFNPSTVISYDVPAKAKVTLTIYNTLGETVATLVNEKLHTPGSYKQEWNGTNLSSGVYFYRLRAITSNGEEFIQSQKMVLLK